MVRIRRQPNRVANEHFDLIVVGGGIYGACLALESARRGLRPLLLERDDFGGKTSWNSLRILHGGLRYLQTFDLPRFRRSVCEQAWWLNQFPDQVQPLSCLLPLYNRGLRRTHVMRTALWMHNRLGMLVREKAIGEQAPFCLPDAQLVSRSAVMDRFPLVDRRGLRGAALWYDAYMAQPQRLQMEVLRWAVACGGTVLNYTECQRVLQRAGRVTGVVARCRETGREFDVRTRWVVNCAGPWSTEVGGAAADPQGLAWAFNVTLSRPPLSSDALAVTPKRKDGPTYFLVPYGKRTMAGTVHLPLENPGGRFPTARQISDFLEDLNRAIPGYGISLDEVTEVLVGRLPAQTAGSGTPARRSRTVYHGHPTGPNGLVSVTGVKFTTARAVAERTLAAILRRQGRPLGEYGQTSRPKPAVLPDLERMTGTCLPSDMAHRLRTWMTEESILHIDDLLLRRVDCDRDPAVLRGLAEMIMQAVRWDDSRRLIELQRLACALPQVVKKHAC